jgi:hypothetical protein
LISAVAGIDASAVVDCAEKVVLCAEKILFATVHVIVYVYGFYFWPGGEFDLLDAAVVVFIVLTIFSSVASASTGVSRGCVTPTMAAGSRSAFSIAASSAVPCGTLSLLSIASNIV